jgi:hypothetical protein
MRFLLPREDYNNLKNRKSARQNRKEAKSKEIKLSEDCQTLQKENEKLRETLVSIQ